MVLLICELLVIGIPPMDITSSIYNLYETLNGVEPIEVLSMSFIQQLSTVVQVLGETIEALKLTDSDSWRQIFTDATSRRQCAFKAFVVGLMDEDGLLDPVIVSSCNF